MKKHIIAAAVAAAVAVPAMAQNVSVYGILDASYGANETKGSATLTTNVRSSGLADSANASSRLGFRGDEDLGGGLKAGFVLESGLNITNGVAFDKSNGLAATNIAAPTQVSGGSAIFGQATRQAFMTVSGGMGTALIGYKKTLDTDFNDTFSLLTDNSAGYEGHEINRITRSNQVAYTSNSFGGLVVSVSHAIAKLQYDATATNTLWNVDGKITQVNAIYTAGPATAGFHFGRGSVDGGTSINTAALGTAIIGVATGNGSYDYNTMAVGGKYNLGFATVTALYGERDYGGSTVVAGAKSKYTEAGVSVPVSGALTVSLGYSAAETDTDAGAHTFDRSGFQLLGQYALSKRTALWGIYGEDKDTGAAADVKRTTARVGLTHSF